MARFKVNSRYTNGIFTLDANNNEFLILRSKLEIAPSGQDMYFVVKGDHLKRLDLISNEVYGQPNLGWAIMDVNNIKQPLFELQIGQQLRIPPLNVLLQAIENLNK